MENWAVIDDTKLRHVWRCADCDCVTRVTPWWYEDTGTPVCEKCGEDMKYLSTEFNNI
jgi:hypothetical protein